MIKIYTDGSCLGNPGPGGWAFLIIDKESKEYSNAGSEQNTTNNKMELMSTIMALKHLNERYRDVERLEIYTDSMYVKNGITDWIKNWQKNNWKTANKKPVMNKELWIEILEITKNLKIEWKWVKAHNGDKYNEIVDQLARNAANLIKN